ncbi:GNAT family N-acetyltransferase [Saliterribacillus persicus]|uniref:Putative acetyltransferase n=1 Tax=Saliterribacillus persicus TaxID=930114 RepID=A0A368XZ28_9BACI|nr:GNAT family N-acetyltransferase [Saliterribacillus persicus]RCW73261.1 putative acetyltransferase [Saliterribacillus persicus]
MFLSQPTIELKEQYFDFYEEWVKSGEEMVPFVIKKNPENFHSMMNYLSNCEKGIEPQVDWVPENSTYWLVDNNEVIGVINLRHRLSHKLFNQGGHIGYGIRPSKRRKGYATTMLLLAFEKARELGLKKVLLVCNSSNNPSIKVILNNGGIRDTDFIDEENNLLKRFWIKL